MDRLTFLVALLGAIFSGLALYYQFIKEHDELRLALADVEYFSETETLRLQLVLVNNGTSPVAVTNMFPMRKYANYGSVHMAGKLSPFVIEPGDVQIKELLVPFDEVDINTIGDADCSPYRLILSFGLVSNNAEYIYNHIHILDFESYTDGEKSGVTKVRYSDILHNLFDDATSFYDNEPKRGFTVLQGFESGAKTSDCWLDI